MKREPYKFFSGVFAGLAWTHAAYAVATSAGIVDEPVFMGRRWGVGYMWTEAVVYSVISLALGYTGWGAKVEEPLQASAVPSGDGQRVQTVARADHPVSR